MRHRAAIEATTPTPNERSRKGRRTLLASILAAGTATAALTAMAASPALASTNVAGAHSAGVAKSAGFKTHARKPSGGGLLVDHGGEVLPQSHTYAIWWGAPTAWSSDVEPGMATLFEGLSGTSFLNTATQYMRGASVSSTFEGATVDTSAPPNKVSPSTLGAEVAKLFGTSVDPEGIYFVFTSNFPKGGNFCAWHSYASVGGKDISVAYMPNTAGVAGCDPGNLYGLSGSQGLRSLANVTSHEFMESITDTLPAAGLYAWIDNSGSEIGDKCAWTFTSPVTLSNGSEWQLQQEWSNAADGCVQTT